MLIVVLALWLLTACDSEKAEKMSPKTIRVFAASSMTNAMADIEEAFEADHPDLDIQVNLAGSKTLRSQIENGAEADLFISANTKHYQALDKQGLMYEGRALLENKLILVVYQGADVEVKSLDDLAKPCQIVIAQEGVPVGNYAREVIKKYGNDKGPDYEKMVFSNVVSQESNVRQVLMKVAMGEGDAALVYKTDVTENVKDSLDVIEIPQAYNVIGTYYMGIIDQAADETKTLYDFIASQEGAEILDKYGFDPLIQ